jgi:hypothetical protein
LAAAPKRWVRSVVAVAATAGIRRTMLAEAIPIAATTTLLHGDTGREQGG